MKKWFRGLITLGILLVSLLSGFPVQAVNGGGTALSFNGTNGVVNCGNDTELAIANSITMEAWVYITAYASNNSGIIGKYGVSGGYSIYTNGGLIYLRVYGITTDNTSIQIPLNAWHHIVATINTSNGTGAYLNKGTHDIIIDGIREQGGNNASGNTSNSGTSNFTIGDDGFTFPFFGEVDEVRLYSRGMTLAEAQTNYALGRVNSPTPSNTTGLIGWWHLDEGTGTSTADLSGNGNTGILSGGVTWDTSTPLVTTLPASAISFLSANASGNLTDIGGLDTTERGLQFGTSTNYTSNWTDTGNFTAGAFTHQFSPLTANTLYHYQAFAVNSAGISYSSDANFTTTAYTLPTITTTAPSLVSFFSATLNGNLISGGNTPVTAKGFQWGTQHSVYTSNWTDSSNSTGPFNHNLANLSNSATYYYRSYATNTGGIIYGNEQHFVTSIPITPASSVSLVFSVIVIIILFVAIIPVVAFQTGDLNQTLGVTVGIIAAGVLCIIGVALLQAAAQGI